MKQISAIALSAFLGLFLSISVIPEAEAKRLGGGTSFGSKPSHSQPAKRSDANTAKSPAQQQNAAQKAALAKKGGMMGLLGGLMIGGLLGALFFGGAFENINFMDILIFGLIAFLLYKIFASKKRHPVDEPATTNGMPFQAEDEQVPQNQQRQHATEFNRYGDEPKEDNTTVLQTGKIPKDFDGKRFLDGAEKVYHLLQTAWDNGDLADIREFCTDQVFAEVQDQFRQRTGENKTKIVSLSSELINVVKNGNTTEATVIFTAELIEQLNSDDSEVIKAQEAWHFLRPSNKLEHTWLLDGIQQVSE